jgi:hypothetical protein
VYEFLASVYGQEPAIRIVDRINAQIGLLRDRPFLGGRPKFAAGVSWPSMSTSSPIR